MTFFLKITRRTHKMAAELHTRMLRAAVALADHRVAMRREDSEAAYTLVAAACRAHHDSLHAVVDAQIAARNIRDAAAKEAALIGQSL